MATRDPVLEELMRNGGDDMRKSPTHPPLDATTSTLSLDVRSEDIGESVCYPPSLLINPAISWASVYTKQQ